MDIITNPKMNNIYSFTYEIITDGIFYFCNAPEIISCTKDTIIVEFSTGFVKLHKNESILISPFVIHRIKQCDFNAEKICFPMKILDLCFSANTFNKYYNKLHTEQKFYVTKNSTVPKIIKEFKKNDDTTEMTNILNIAELLYLFSEEAESDSDLLTLRSNQTFLNMIGFIEHNLSSYISTKTLSERFRLTSSHIGYIFKNSIGISPITYITNYKLSEATKMLITTNKNVKSICSACGFNSIIYFQSIFKEAYGITPKQYQTTLSLNKV